MQVTDATGSNEGARQLGPGVSLVPLYPTAHAESALLAVDLLEIEAGSVTPQLEGSAEQVLFVLSGRGQVTGAGVKTHQYGGIRAWMAYHPRHCSIQ
jgi:hypothetical protein